MAIRKILTRAIDSTASSANLNIDSNTLFVDATNNRVGIGTNAPNAALTVGSGTVLVKNAASDSNGLRIYQAASDVSSIFNYYSGTLALGTNNTERMRIDAVGKVGIGVTNPNGKLHIGASSASDYAVIGFANASGSTPAWIGLKGDQTSSLSFFVASNIEPSNTFERMRIDSGGIVTINSTSTGFGRLFVDGANGAGTAAITARPNFAVGTFYSALRAAPSDGSTDGGVYIGSLYKDNSAIASGAYYYNSGTWIPATTTSSGISFSGGWVNFNSNQGLTAGTAFTPSTKTQISPDGKLYHYGETSINAVRRLSLSPGVWRFTKNSIAALFDLEFRMGGVNYSLGTDQPRVLRSIVMWRYSTGWGNTNYVANIAFGGSTANYSSNGVGYCVTNLTSTTMDIQIHNSGSQSVDAMYCNLEIYGVNGNPDDISISKITNHPGYYTANPY